MSDLFISYVSRDKNIAKTLIDAFTEQELSVTQVRFGIGDTLGNSMKTGFENATFGILILSPNFFKMPWPRSDLDDLAQIDRIYKNSQTRLLPVWCHISQQEIANYSTALAQRIGAQYDSDDDLEFMFDDLMAVIQPESPTQIKSTSKGIMSKSQAEINYDPNPTDLLKQMSTYFNNSELRALCFKLDIEYENLGGESKDAKILSLIQYVRRHARLNDLMKILAKERPKVQWG